MSGRKKNALVQRVEYGLYRAISAAVARISDERTARWGSRLGTVSRMILRRRDRLAMSNLALCFPEKSDGERRSILNECWRHFGREMLGYVRMQRMSMEEIASRCQLDGQDILEKAVAAGRGVVLISAHFGSWEVGGLALMSLVKNVRTVARRLDNELLEGDLAVIRARTGAEVIDRRNAARALMRGLAEKAVIVLLPDQAVLPREGVAVPFLGRDAWTTDAPAKMALRRGSPIVFGFCIPEGTRHRMEFRETIWTSELGDDERDPTALTARINDIISARIAACPELWLWMHDRWKGIGMDR